MNTTLNWRSGGNAKTHTVVKQTGETTAQFMARAQTEFEEQLELYPPD